MESPKIFELRKTNKSNVYRYLYTHRQCARQEIAADLQLSLPTVAQNLKELQEAGLLEREGHFASTGGRKAAVLAAKADAAAAAGLEILQQGVCLVVCDLYGRILFKRELDMSFRPEEAYYHRLGDWTKSALAEAPLAQTQFLGLSAAVQGLVSADGQQVEYGRLLGNSGMTAAALSAHLSLPCTLVHDSKAAAFAESFFRPDRENACYLFLNRNLGSALILNHAVYSGRSARGQTAEHSCLVPGGRLCYCGRRGCCESYLSAGSLEAAAGEPLDSFFRHLRAGEPAQTALWRHYLDDLSAMICNLLMMMDVDVVLGGLLRSYMTPEDAQFLHSAVQQRSDFPIAAEAVTLEQCLEHPAALGAALQHIRAFLDTI